MLPAPRPYTAPRADGPLGERSVRRPPSVYAARVVTVRFTFSGAETRRVLRYMLLRSRGPTAMLGCGVAILAVAVSLGKPLWYAVAGAELLGWILSFSEDGVTAANARGSQRFEWSHWRRWNETGDLYLLRGRRGVFTFIPRRAFASSDAEGEFRSLLARHLPGGPGRRRTGGAAGQEDPLPSVAGGADTP
jgi:hypothetical protein